MNFYCCGCCRDHKWTDDNKYSLNGYVLCKSCFDSRAQRCTTEWLEEKAAHHKISDECDCQYDDPRCPCCDYGDEYDDYEFPLLKKCEFCIERENESSSRDPNKTE